MNLQENSIFVISLWNVNISCKFIISGRKHLCLLKLLAYTTEHETYAWTKLQVEIEIIPMKIVEIQIGKFFRWFTLVFSSSTTFHYATIFFVHFSGEYYLQWFVPEVEELSACARVDTRFRASEARKIFMVDMYFVDSRMFEMIEGRKPHGRDSQSPNFCHLHIVDIFFGKVHTDRLRILSVVWNIEMKITYNNYWR